MSLFDASALNELLEGGSPKNKNNQHPKGRMRVHDNGKGKPDNRKIKTNHKLAKKLFDEDEIDDKKKSKLIDMYVEHSDVMRAEIRAYYDNQSKIFSDKEDLASVLVMPKFAKAITGAMKEEEKLYPEFYSVIGDLFNAQNKALIGDTEVLTMYLKTLAEFKKKEVKTIAKKLGIEKNVALEIILVTMVSDPQNKRALNSRYRNLINVLAKNEDLENIEDVSNKQLKFLVKTCFGDGLGRFINFALTEVSKKRQIDTELDEFILKYLEEMKKSELTEMLVGYSKRVKKNPKIRKRINFLKVDEDDYPKVHAVVKKQINVGRDKNTFSA